MVGVPIEIDSKMCLCWSVRSDYMRSAVKLQVCGPTLNKTLRLKLVAHDLADKPYLYFSCDFKMLNMVFGAENEKSVKGCKVRTTSADDSCDTNGAR